LLVSDQMTHYHSLARWFSGGLGLFVAKEVCKELQSIPNLPSGQTLLQLGSGGENAWLDKLSFKNKWIASPTLLRNSHSVQCSLEELPFTRNSLDCLVVPLTLELYPNHYDLLDEIDRVLKPMGHVIFICLNPWSPWGLALRCGLLDLYAKAHAHLHTPSHLHRTFLQRGYRQCFLGHFCYIPPINKASVLEKLVFLDEMGKMLWPFPSGLYCYIAQKYEYAEPDELAFCDSVPAR